MSNALDYLEWRGDLTMEASQFNEIDMFLCSQLSTPDYTEIMGRDDEPITIGKMAERYFVTHSMKKEESIGVLQSDYLLPTFKKMALTERFKHVKLWKPENKVILENTEQFSAVTVCIPNGDRIISIRGTDDTIIGWKEDFSIAYSDNVAAQNDALSYLLEVAEECPESKLYLCGHSKGGNLAIYAAAKAPESVQDRIEKVVNFDGPGFREEFLDDDGYQRIKNKVETVLSQNSMVGTLLTRVGTVKYVTSSEHGPMAHDGFSWQVMGKKFIDSEGLSDTSMAFEKAMKETIEAMGEDEMQEFTNDLFDALLSTGAKTIAQLTALPPKAKLDMFVNLRNEKKVTKFVNSVLSIMFKSVGNEIISRI